QCPRHLLPSLRSARGPHPTPVSAVSGCPRDGDGTLGTLPVGGLLSDPLSGLPSDSWDVIRPLCARRAFLRRRASSNGNEFLSSVRPVVPPPSPRAALMGAGTG